MRKYLLILIILLFACRPSGNKTTISKYGQILALKNDTSFETDSFSVYIQGDGHKFVTFKKIDSNILKEWWNYAALPLIKKDKKDFINKVNFPLLGDWTRELRLNIEPEVATEKDFVDVYDKLFNNEFIDSLSKQSYKDIDVCAINDVPEFQIIVCKRYKEHPEFGGAGIILCFSKINDTIKLYKFMGVGGDFY